MSVPLEYSRDLIEKLIESIVSGKGSVKIDGKKITLTSDVEVENRKAKILFSPLAYEKQHALIDHCTKEVGWHGFVKRSEEDDHVFVIEDIVVYPQEVTGTTITPDQEEYEKWRDALDDEHFNSCLYHGHSHVNMATSPSGTDTKYQHDVLDGLTKDQFLVFMIWNKKGEHWAQIYDKRHNCIYQNADIDVGVTGCDMEAFLKEADGLVREYKYQAPATTKPVSTPKYQSYKSYSYDYDDDDVDDPYGSCCIIPGFFDDKGTFHKTVKGGKK